MRRGPVPPRGRLVGVLLLAMAAGWACGDLLQEPDTGFSKLRIRVEEVSGNGQTGVAGSALAQPVRVRVVDGDEEPLPRLRVEWLVTGGSGSAAPRDAFTDEDGVAVTTWTLGSETGSQKLRAQVREEVFVDFGATSVEP